MVPVGSCCARHIRIYEPLALSRAQPVRMIPQNHAVAVALVTRPTSSYDPPKSRRGRRCKRTFVSSFIPIYYNQVNQVPRGLSFSFTRSVLRGKALSFIFTHPPVDKTKQGQKKVNSVLSSTVSPPGPLPCITHQVPSTAQQYRGRNEGEGAAAPLGIMLRAPVPYIRLLAMQCSSKFGHQPLHLGAVADVVAVLCL